MATYLVRASTHYCVDPAVCPRRQFLKTYDEVSQHHKIHACRLYSTGNSLAHHKRMCTPDVGQAGWIRSWHFHVWNKETTKKVICREGVVNELWENVSHCASSLRITQENIWTYRKWNCKTSHCSLILSMLCCCSVLLTDEKHLQLNNTDLLMIADVGGQRGVTGLQ